MSPLLFPTEMYGKTFTANVGARSYAFQCEGNGADLPYTLDMLHGRQLALLGKFLQKKTDVQRVSINITLADFPGDTAIAPRRGMDL
jgi:hypothetical protein